MTAVEAGETRRGRRAGVVSRIAWAPERDLRYPEWVIAGRRLGAIGRCSQWWIGDWLRYGTSRWGEKYAEAARVTGYDAASLRNIAWVAGCFDLSLRNDKLSWSHHVLLAPLDPAQQRYWLDRAARERLSVADLRLELRARGGLRRGRAGAGKLEAGEGAGEERVVCPHCGHAVAAAAR